MEIWKDIIGYEGLYKISEHGEIKSFVKKKIIILKKAINLSGYYHVNLSQTTTDVHIIVAKHFVENPENKKYVNHKDLDKLNNHYTNLEWTTNRENCYHFHKLNGIQEPGISKIGKKFQVRIRINGPKEYHGRFNTIEEAILKRDSVIKAAPKL